MSSADPALAAEASIWLGDALYRAGDNKAAENAYLAALRGRLSAANAPLARYGLAYSQFSARRWNDAAANFAAVAADRSASADIRATPSSARPIAYSIRSNTDRRPTNTVRLSTPAAATTTMPRSAMPWWPE